ncbi:hypothetical protein [Pseudidiomarina aestuarii]|uniref:hypothetical protein n=1 Tax=Pseudidiomarina aestuarii TaxID=624146 RepID=UPI003A97796D
MSRKTKKRLLLAALAATGAYGEDHIIDNAVTPIAMQTMGLEVTPIEATEIDREFDNGRPGNNKFLVVGKHCKVTFSVELTGGGGATQPANYSSLLQACGFSETVGLDDVTYARIINNTEKDITLHAYIDGVNHKVLGARGTYKHVAKVGEVPKIEFEFTGLFGGLAGENIPEADFSGWQTPAAVGAKHTTFMLDGNELELHEFELDGKNEVAYFEGTKTEKVHLTDWKPDGKIVFEAPAHADFDPTSIYIAGATMPISLVHGTVVGNIVTIDSTSIQLGKPSYGDKDGMMTFDCPFRVIDDETLATS